MSLAPFFLKRMSLAPQVFLFTLVYILMSLAPVNASPVNLRFNQSGTFTIVQFTDIQHTFPVDPEIISLMESVLDEANPQFVVITGDILSEKTRTREDVSGTIYQVASPMTTRDIPWAIILGNHDEDHTPVSGMDADEILRLCISLPFNINRPSPAGITGRGVMYLPVYGARDNTPELILWCMDSGTYTPWEPLPIPPGRKPDYAWIGRDQINWYRDTSVNLAKKYGHPIPGIMFFHIPLPEFEEMYSLPEIYPVIGKLNEEVSSGYINSGFMAAVLRQGDVLGIFTGHDHYNDLQGIYRGIYLCYGASTGFGTYGQGEKNPYGVQGARVIKINHQSLVKLETSMIYSR